MTGQGATHGGHVILSLGRRERADYACHMDLPDLSPRLELAGRMARDAGDVTLRYFNHDNFDVETKADASPDCEAEKCLRRHITAAFPDDGILGEELGEQAGTSGFRWILDPIDGTQSFIHGVPLYGTLIGLEHEGRSVLGVISIPALRECVWGALGHGAWYIRDGQPRGRAKVSSRERLADSLFCTSDFAGYATTGRQAALARLAAAAKRGRTWGDCYGYLLVATGRAEVMVDPVMNIWDAAAIQPIMEEAGGTFTDWQGRSTIHAREGIATNGRLLEEVLAITRQA
jgi:histidinol-phosphatase